MTFLLQLLQEYSTITILPGTRHKFTQVTTGREVARYVKVGSPRADRLAQNSFRGPILKNSFLYRHLEPTPTKLNIRGNQTGDQKPAAAYKMPAPSRCLVSSKPSSPQTYYSMPAQYVICPQHIAFRPRRRGSCIALRKWQRLPAASHMVFVTDQPTVKGFLLRAITRDSGHSP